jgi:hypothetical protein
MGFAERVKYSDLGLTVQKFGPPKSLSSKAVFICECSVIFDKLLRTVRDDSAPQCRSCTVKSIWKRPGFRELISASTSVTSKIMWQNEEYRKTSTDRSQKAWSDPALLKRASEEGKLRWEDPSYRQNRMASNQYLQDPGFRKNV